MTNKQSAKQLIARYINGNYTVRLYNDGTKIKHTKADEFVAEFPDSIDLKITNRCDMACPMCHESSCADGVEGDLSATFLTTLRKGTELAIGGGNPLSHNGLENFLVRMKLQGVICNLTVNEKHFLQNQGYLELLIAKQLIWGLGISLTQYDANTIEFAAQHKNTVLHVICGIIDAKSVQKLYNKGLKTLFLGYKHFGRGKSYYSAQVEEKIHWLKNNIAQIGQGFDTVCFDNLALEQLDIRNKISSKLYDERYMGNDGSASMYVDLVERKCARSSTSIELYPLQEDIRAMFNAVRI